MSPTEYHLRTQLNDRERQFDTMTRRIAALDTDIGRELDSERKLVLQERRADLAAERDQVIGEISRIARQLDSFTGQIDHPDPGDTRGMPAPSVQPPVAQAPAPQPVAPYPQTVGAPPDLQLLITLSPDDKNLSYTLNSPGGDYNFLQLGSVALQASPRELLQRTFDHLSTLAHLSPEKRSLAQTEHARREWQTSAATCMTSFSRMRSRRSTAPCGRSSWAATCG